MAKPKKRTVSAGGGTSPLAATIFDLRCLMQRRTSLFCIACMLVCLASLSSWSAEQVVKFRVEALAKFGISAAHPDEKPLTLFSMCRTACRAATPYTSLYGGAGWRRMFTAVAAAEEGMNSCPDLKIDSKARDGAHSWQRSTQQELAGSSSTLN